MERGWIPAVVIIAVILLIGILYSRDRDSVADARVREAESVMAGRSANATEWSLREAHGPTMPLWMRPGPSRSDIRLRLEPQIDPNRWTSGTWAGSDIGVATAEYLFSKDGGLDRLGELRVRVDPSSAAVPPEVRFAIVRLDDRRMILHATEPSECRGLVLVFVPRVLENAPM